MNRKVIQNKIKKSETITRFQKKVYTTILLIPPGKVASYKWVAKKLGIRSAQAVGQALKRNPLAPEVPCHRVIASDGSLGGFQGEKSSRTLRKKKRLLRTEGVSFDVSGRLADYKALIQ